MEARQIRDADRSDAADIARVHVRAWEAAYQGLLSDAVIRVSGRRRRQWWTSYLDAIPDGEYVLVAVQEREVAGFASARPSPDEDAEPGQMEVGGLYVEPGAWGKGIGSALVLALLDRLRLDGTTSVTLWVLAANKPARRFYERRGWLLDGAERVHPDRGAPEFRYRIGLDPPALHKAAPARMATPCATRRAPARARAA